MKDFFEAIGTFMLGLLLVVIISFIPALVVMLCWNCVIPVIFGLTTITFWQAYALYLLCYCLIRTSITTKKD